MAFMVSDARAAVAVREPNLAQLVPPNYRVLGVWHARLTGQSMPEVVVTSVGPLNRYGLHPADVQVISWDALAYRWNVVFDAQRVRYQSAPVIDPKAEVRISQLAFVRFSRAAGRELVFAASTYGDTRVVGEMVVVGFRNAEARIDYRWSGDWGVTFRVAGSAPKQTVAATGVYRAVVDPLSQPVRRYQFTVGLQHDFLRVLHDNRPWVGLFVTGTDQSPLTPLGTPRSHLRVLEVVPHSPAAAAFRVGDVIVGLTAPYAPKPTKLLGPALIHEIAAQHAGERVGFNIRRGNQYLRLTLRLGSLIDPSAPGTAPSINNKFALV